MTDKQNFEVNARCEYGAYLTPKAKDKGVNNITDKQIIVDGLSCYNCPEAQRCQEQRAKKEYAINQVLQDIPSEYANVITRLRQIIPSITRCDYVLEKQLKRKEQECEELKEQFKLAEPLYQSCNIKDKKINKYKQQLDQLKAENDLYKNAHKTEQDRRRSYENALAEIKESAEKHAPRCNDNSKCDYDCDECHLSDLKQILQKISEVENGN